MKARITIELGSGSKDYVDILGSGQHQKDSRIKIKRQANGILIEIEAGNGKALLSSANSVLRQLRIANNTMELLP